MQYFLCDLCGCRIDEQHYVVNIDVSSAIPTEDQPLIDFDVDHLQVVAESISAGTGMPSVSDPSSGTGPVQFDLCEECQCRFRRDPLGKTARTTMRFSEN